jgi:hypothetical protein
MFLARHSRSLTIGRVMAAQPSVTALSRWSILNKQLPEAGKIKALHVYDFDNTRASCRNSGPAYLL